MTMSRSSVTLLVLVLLPLPAFAEGNDGDPAQAVEEVDAPRPKIISSGQDAGGHHAFLAVTPKGPMVFWGPKDEVAELDVLSMQRIKDGFLVDTLEEGEIIFETGRTPRVIKRGGVGFNAHPTRVMSNAVEAGALDHVRRQLPGASPKSSVAVEVSTDAAHVRFPAARNSAGSGRLRGGVTAHKAGVAPRAQARARVRTRARARVR